MDYISHGLWSYIAFFRNKPWFAVLFGLMPDTISWGAYFVYRIFSGEALGKPVLDAIPSWVHHLYGVSHSLVICAAILIALYVAFDTLPLYVLAWPLAIVLDVFTHTRDFLPTPFLYPISDYAFPGISWASPVFLILNFGLIIIALLLMLVYEKKWLH